MADASPQAPPTDGGLLIGFVAGVVAVAVFHQLASLAFGYVGLGEGAVYSFRLTWPLGAPRILSQMFWGGVWGVVFAALADRLPAQRPAVRGLVFSLCGPALFGWTVLAAVRGQALFGGLDPTRVAASVLINGSFGVGLALIFTWLRGFVQGGRRAT